MTGLWRIQIIVACMSCNKPMGWHQVTTEAACNLCKAEASQVTEYGNICIDHTSTDKGATT